MYDSVVFGALAAEVGDLEVPVDAHALVELLSIRQRFEAVVVEALGAFDAAKLWDLDAATSMHAWLRDQGQLTSSQSARLTRTARKLRQLPETLAAWKDGRLSGGQVEAVVTIVGTKVDRFDEAVIVPELESLDLEQTTMALQHWRRRVDDEDPIPEEPSDPPSRLYLSGGLDGRGLLDGELDVDHHQRLKTALRLAAPDDRDLTPAEQRAEAHDTIVSYFLDNQTSARGGSHRPHVNVFVDLDGSNPRYEDGTAMSREVLERTCCDSAFHRISAMGRSTIIDLGTTTRVLSAAIRAGMVARDVHCRFPGCDRPASWCDGHHVVWFSRGGATRLDNLVLLCRRHHKRLHRLGWEAKLLPDGTFEVTDPTGRVRTTWPPGALPLARAG